MTPKLNYKVLLNPEYMGAYSLDNGNYGYNEIDSVIISVQPKEIVGDGGIKSAGFIGITDQKKPFIINATARKLIARYCKSQYHLDWVNIPITFYVEKGVRDPSGGKGAKTDGLRIKIRETAPQVDYSKQAETLQACQTMEELQKAFLSLTAAEQAGTFNVKETMKTKLS